ncbi:MAG: hypothetical protein KDE14_08865 [Rhodobacteraceae bacterium]|nr:hypothetical protein [Paracoccaceae bacterium]
MRAFGALVVLAAALSGCGTKPDPIMAQFAGYHCGAPGSSAPSFMCASRPPGEAVAEVSRFCYATLADANCFDRPDPDRKNHAQGSSGY